MGQKPENSTLTNYGFYLYNDVINGTASKRELQLTNSTLDLATQTKGITEMTVLKPTVNVSFSPSRPVVINPPVARSYGKPTFLGLPLFFVKPIVCLFSIGLAILAGAMVPSFAHNLEQILWYLGF